MGLKSTLPTGTKAGLETSYDISLGYIQETHYPQACPRPMQEPKVETRTQLRHRLGSQA